MKTVIKTFLILLITLNLAFVTSLLLEIPLVQKHWTRVALVLILMLVELLVGFGMVVILGKSIKQ